MVCCADGTLYTGITTDLTRRIGEHNAGRGARYTKTRRPVSLAAAWRFEATEDTSAHVRALKAERRFKKQRRARKLKIIEAGGGWDEGTRL